MQKLWSLFSSPRHLVFFEAAARTGSFTQAAQELNVQQPAVSMAIKQLEDSLGVMLFQRSHRKITLTNAGNRLFSDVTRAFEQLAQSAAAIRQFTSNDHVTLSASSAFNNYWMLPRIRSFQANHPDIDLRLQSSNREPDLNVETISLAVRLGTGDWPDCDSALIAEEEIYPVAAPRVMASAVNLTNVAMLLAQRLIHLEEPIRERPSWQQWFQAIGVDGIPPSGGLRLNDYALVLQAAMAGEGFAFGWHHVVDPLVRQGLLTARRDWTWKTGRGFYLVWSKSHPLIPKAEIVRDWILSEAQSR
ncbi:LysR substrate-binding domain-containing protein [Pacificoceanicola onchidii]|uniref:LysR substrate-binding domain-containing protein n=1 Tax=Pacificoceanicola onchidii TaxID=2562685 RepID=UPI0010A4FFF8|nr:LysR substrate-binding domain-containing protein [Pacificoceanicola onchidii]